MTGTGAARAVVPQEVHWGARVLEKERCRKKDIPVLQILRLASGAWGALQSENIFPCPTKPKKWCGAMILGIVFLLVPLGTAPAKQMGDPTPALPATVYASTWYADESQRVVKRLREVGFAVREIKYREKAAPKKTVLWAPESMLRRVNQIITSFPRPPKVRMAATKGGERVLILLGRDWLESAPPMPERLEERRPPDNSRTEAGLEVGGVIWGRLEQEGGGNIQRAVARPAASLGVSIGHDLRRTTSLGLVARYYLGQRAKPEGQGESLPMGQQGEADAFVRTSLPLVPQSLYGRLEAGLTDVLGTPGRGGHAFGYNTGVLLGLGFALPSGRTGFQAETGYSYAQLQVAGTRGAISFALLRLRVTYRPRKSGIIETVEGW